MTRTRLAVVVTNLGFQVITTADEAEAWAAFTECAPDIAIACWDRPGFDALALTRRMRDAAGDQCFRIIVAAREARADVTQAVAAGVDDYLSTPIDADQFRARLIMAEELVRFRRAQRLAGSRGLVTVGQTCRDDQTDRAVERPRHAPSIPRTGDAEGRNTSLDSDMPASPPP